MKETDTHLIKEIHGIRDYVNANLSDSFLESHFKGKLGKGFNQIQKAFVKHFGKNIKQYIHEQRMTLALELLKQGEQIKTVSAAVGRSDSGFRDEFNRYYGYNPSQVISQKPMEVAPLLPEVDIDQIKQYILENVHQALNVNQVAKYAGVNKFDLDEIFANKTGIKLYDYIQEIRVNQVTQYLDAKMNMDKICSTMNFASVQALESFIRRNLGVSLQAMRKDHLSNYKPETGPDKNKTSMVKDITKYIRINLESQNLKLDIKNTFHLSVFLMDKAFLETLNMSLTDYILKERMEYAKELLVEKMTLGRIAENVGYCSEVEFVTDFRSYYGESAEGMIGNLSKYNLEEFTSIKNYIEDNISTEVKLSKLAESVGLSKEQVMKIMSQYTHLDFTEYVKKTRIEKAKELLSQKLDLEVIAQKVGYVNALGLQAAFQKSLGISIKKYQAQQK